MPQRYLERAWAEPGARKKPREAALLLQRVGVPPPWSQQPGPGPVQPSPQLSVTQESVDKETRFLGTISPLL